MNLPGSCSANIMWEDYGNILALGQDMLISRINVKGHPLTSLILASGYRVRLSILSALIRTWALISLGYKICISGLRTIRFAGARQSPARAAGRTERSLSTGHLEARRLRGARRNRVWRRYPRVYVFSFASCADYVLWHCKERGMATALLLWPVEWNVPPWPARFRSHEDSLILGETNLENPCLLKFKSPLEEAHRFWASGSGGCPTSHWGSYDRLIRLCFTKGSIWHEKDRQERESYSLTCPVSFRLSWLDGPACQQFSAQGRDGCTTE